MVQPDVMKIVMEEMADGCRSSFEECSLIMKGIGFKKKIPKEFWEDEEQAGLGIIDIYVPLSKSELKRIREEVISEICFRLHNDCYKCFTVEHYSNYLHGLAILEVPKDTRKTPKKYLDWERILEDIIWHISCGNLMMVPKKNGIQ